MLLPLLVGGAIVNVAVAWGCAIWIDASKPEQRVGLTDLRGPQWLFGIRSRPGAALVFMRPRWFEQYEVRGALLEGSVPYWSKAAGRPDPDDRYGLYANPDFVRMEGANGWPLLSMIWKTDTDDVAWAGGRGTQSVDWGLEIARDLSRRPPYLQRRALPLLPIWPGFAINTLFYAAILWALFAAPLALRRRLRIRRGLCPACAYPVGESPICTECGAPFPSPIGRGVRGEGGYERR
jgi:hypothetical protein